MPQSGATYEYDETKSGLVLSYAYSLALKRGNKIIAEDMLRGEESFEAVTCGGQRIRNAFGGTLQTNSYANSQMQARCTQNATVPTKSEIRAVVIKKIALKVDDMAQAALQ